MANKYKPDEPGVGVPGPPGPAGPSASIIKFTTTGAGDLEDYTDAALEFEDPICMVDGGIYDEAFWTLLGATVTWTPNLFAGQKVKFIF